jgi:tryptophan synthase alpha chain
VAPTTPEERIAQIVARATGFIYVVSLTGVTGARQSMAANLGALLARVRRHTDLPLVVGFGISSPAHVAEVAELADGAIVGSALIAHLEQLAPAELVPGAASFVRELLPPL